MISERLLKYPRHNKKLVATHVVPQTNYLVSLKLLQSLMVRRVYSFTQKEFLEPLIRGNVKKRAQAVGESRQMAFECLSNSIFGRCLLNPLNRSLKTRVVTKPEHFLTVVNDPHFQRMIPPRTNRLITVSKTPFVYMSQPQYIGYHILELAKYQIYYFWYKIFKRSL